MQTLLDAVGDVRQFFWLTGLAMARLTPIFQMVPFLGGRHLSGLIRNSFAFALALFLRPWLAANLPPGELDMTAMTPLLAKEVLLGTLFGVISSFAFYAASGIGFLVDNQRGSSMAELTDPLTGDQTSPLGSLTMETLTMVFVAGGGLTLFFQAILTSYSFWPPFSFWPDWSASAWTELLLGQFAWYMTTIVAMAAPMLMVCFLVDLGMGLMNRFAPQMNVFFLSMPVKSALTLTLMIVYWGAMFRVLGGEVMRLPVVWDALKHALTLS